MNDEGKNRAELQSEIDELRRQVALLNRRASRTEEEIIAETMSRLSRELHGGIAQDMAAINMRMSVWHHLVGDDPGRAAAEIEDLKDLLGENIRRLKQLIFILRPMAGTDLGFYPAMRMFIGDFAEQNELSVDFHVAGDELTPPFPMQFMWFRVLQECLHNIERHASAHGVTIEFNTEHPASVGLVIRDDGVGFHPDSLEDASRARGLGLKRLRQRVESLGGTLSVRSQPGAGTQVEVVLNPVNFQGM